MSKSKGISDEIKCNPINSEDAICANDSANIQDLFIGLGIIKTISSSIKKMKG